MKVELAELMRKLGLIAVTLSECNELQSELECEDYEKNVDWDRVTQLLIETSFSVDEARHIVEGAISYILEPSREYVKKIRKDWEVYDKLDDEDDSEEYVNEESGIRCNKWGEPIFDGCMDAWDDDDEICTECDDDEDDETDSESNCGDVSRPKRSPLDDTVSNESERTHKDTVEEFKRKLGLEGDTDIRTLWKDADSKKLYEGEWDVSKGMRLTFTRKKDDSVHMAVPCKLEKNAQLHHFKNVDGINMSAIYTENEDGEFWVEEASCMLADEWKMITW